MYQNRAASWMTAHTIVPILLCHFRAATRVRIMKVTYTMEVSIRVLSVMFLNCFLGPHKKQELLGVCVEWPCQEDKPLGEASRV